MATIPYVVIGLETSGIDEGEIGSGIMCDRIARLDRADVIEVERLMLRVLIDPEFAQARERNGLTAGWLVEAVASWEAERGDERHPSPGCSLAG